MNRKTFTLSVLFLCVTLVWMGLNIYWAVTHKNCVHVFDFVVGVLFVAAAAAMVWNECKKKKRRHLARVSKHQIP